MCIRTYIYIYTHIYIYIYIVIVIVESQELPACHGRGHAACDGMNRTTGSTKALRTIYIYNIYMYIPIYIYRERERALYI